LFLDGVKMKVARHPNSGYSYISTKTSNTVFASAGLDGSISYAGAKWVGRTNAWVIRAIEVASSNGQSVTLASAPHEGLTAGNGFFLAGKLAFLDSAGEWFYDPASKAVYLWAPDGGSPENREARGSVHNSAVSIGNKSNVTVKGFWLLHCATTGIDASSCTNVTLADNDISWPDSKGVELSGASYCTISGNMVEGANHYGINAYSSNCKFADNHVLNTALFDNLGLTGMGFETAGRAINIEGADNVVAHNRIINAGFNGVGFMGRNTVEYNFIKDVCLVKDDGGGIYTWGGSSPSTNPSNSNSVVRGNIVVGVHGNKDGATQSDEFGFGIYMDRNSGNVTIEGNTVANTMGILLLKNNNIVVRGNTIMDAKYPIYMSGDNAPNTVTGNTIYALAADRHGTPQKLIAERLTASKHIYNNNTYINHYNNNDIFLKTQQWVDPKSDSHSFAEWRAVTGQDANSTIDVSPLAAGEKEELFYNDTKQTKTINLGNVVYRDVNGAKVSGNFTLEPFTSKILVKTTVTTIPDNIPPTISSFSILSTSTSLTIPITSLIANDANGISGYMLTEDPSAPNAGDSRWSTIAPSQYTFTSNGNKTLYAWAKDVAGNISKSSSAQVSIELFGNNGGTNGNILVGDLVSTASNRRATPVTFTSAAIIESISIFHNGGTGNILMGVYSDEAGTPSTQLGVTSSTTINSSAGWQTVSLTTPVTVSSGQIVWLSWVFQNNPGIRYFIGTPARAQSSESWSSGMPTAFGPSTFADYNYSIYCTYSTDIGTPTPQDISKPVINEFIVPTTSSSLVVEVNRFTASDNIGVTGYLLTESATTPSIANSGWDTKAPASFAFTSEGDKTLYAWTKDAAGNISTSKNAQVTITLPDVTKPVITAFTIPSTSSSLIVDVTSFAATDNKTVAGYLLTESATTPSIANSGWDTKAPASFTFTSDGDKTLYAWTKDAAGNISTSKNAQVTITLPDVIKPVITAFTIPRTSSSLIVDVTSFTATDNKTVAGYLLTESATTPSIANSGWDTKAPASFTFTSEGDKTLYAWTKDAAGNISTSKNAQVTITLLDTTKPVIVSFQIPETTESFTIPITSFDAIDDNEVTGYLVSEADTCPSASIDCWSLLAPETYTFSSDDVLSSALNTNQIGLKSGYQSSTNYIASIKKTLHAWTKDAAGNISTAETDDVVINIPDVEPPSITEFTIPTTSSSLKINIFSLKVSDNNQVSGVILSENPTVPNANDPRWDNLEQVSFTFNSEGTKTLYAWAKDAAGNISESKNSTVIIILPDNEKPLLTTFSIPTSSSSLTINIDKIYATDNIAVAGYLITESRDEPSPGNPGWKTTAPASITFTSEGTKTLYAWAKDAAGNVSASKSASVLITLIPKPHNAIGFTDVFNAVTVSDNRRAMPVSFNEKVKIESISIYHNGGSGNMMLGVYSDISGSPASRLGVTPSTVVNANEGWQTISLSSPVVVNPGQTVWLSWVFQNNPGIRYSAGTPARAQSDNLWSTGMPSDYGKSSFANYKYSIYCSFTTDLSIPLPIDATKPAITAFNVIPASSTLTATITNLTATDNNGVTGYKLTDTPNEPLAGDAGWLPTAPTSYTFTSEGTKMLFAWTKDAAGNISTSVARQVIIQLPPEEGLPEGQSITQSIELKRGWNIFSTYVAPKSQSMDSVLLMLQVNERLNIVQDKAFNTYEKCPVTHNWLNNIGDIQKTEGYMIKVEANCSLEISGQPIRLPFNIDIKRGWNIISFPIEGSVDGMKVVQPLIDAGVLYKIQDERGYSIENWRKLGWMNGIGNFNAGEGYILQAYKSGVLTINDLSAKSSLNFAERTETSYFKPCYEGNGINHMNINLVDLNETGFQVGDEIAAFDGDKCVGAIKLTVYDLSNNLAGMAVSASDIGQTVGFIEGNPIELNVWKNENGEENKFTPQIIEGKLIFEKQASVFASLNSQATSVADMFDNLAIGMYPNPASSHVTVTFSTLPTAGTKIVIVDITGNEIHSQYVQNSQETINIEHLPSGMYLVKTELQNKHHVQKLIKK
jgi:parallel beta-helix repeat protein